MNSWIPETNNKRRDKFCIIAEILEIAKTGALKTQIMYKANLNFAQLKEYLKFMVKIKLIKKLKEKGRDTYFTTEKGLDFLQTQCELADLLKTGKEKLKDNMKIPSLNQYR